MLILTVKDGGHVRVEMPDGSVGWITLVGLRRGSVKLGFEFDREVRIHRDEVIVGGEHYETHRRT